jgi:hypothetical protein
MFCTYDASSAFTQRPSRAFVATSTQKARTTPFMTTKSSSSSNSNSWNEEHLIHGASEIHEETEEEIRESEMAAAFDAHDCSDPGMEAAMEEGSLMTAQYYAHQLKEKNDLHKGSAAEPIKNKVKSWNEEHLIHGAHEIHEETDDELRESEDAAAYDAHDSIDSGMEAAMEERAVMLARELAHKMKEQAMARQQNNDGKK